MRRRIRRRTVSLLVAAAMVLSMVAPVGVDVYYTAPTEPLVLSFEKQRVRR